MTAYGTFRTRSVIRRARRLSQDSQRLRQTSALELAPSRAACVEGSAQHNYASAIGFAAEVEAALEGQASNGGKL